MGTAPLIQVQGVSGRKINTTMPSRFKEVSVHPILTAPGDIKKTGNRDSKRARNQRPNVGGVFGDVQIDRDDIHLEDMRGGQW